MKLCGHDSAHSVDSRQRTVPRPAGAGSAVTAAIDDQCAASERGSRETRDGQRHRGTEPFRGLRARHHDRTSGERRPARSLSSTVLWPRRVHRHAGHAHLSDLLPDEGLQPDRAVVVLVVVAVVHAAVFAHAQQVSEELVERVVVRRCARPRREPRPHRRQVHWVLDHLVVVRRQRGGDGGLEGPRIGVCGNLCKHGLQAVGERDWLALHGAVQRALPPRRPLQPGRHPSLRRVVPRVLRLLLLRAAHLHPLRDRAALLLGDEADVEVVHLRVDGALHQRASVVVLDVPQPPLALHRHLLLEALLAEVANRVVVGVREKKVDPLTLAVLLELIHQPRAVPAHLVRRRDGAEGDFCKRLRCVPPVGDAAHDLALKDAGERGVRPVKDEPYDVLLPHFWQLLRVDALHVDQRDERAVEAVVLDDDEAQTALTLVLRVLPLSRQRRLVRLVVDRELCRGHDGT
mmetsp:Transcript_40236/g.126971  ORF Transcript_40236/g.126971 Transcript_40236/m.126971 type:complete len:460 (-) Transcript_40236:28-1407(-)